MKNIHYLLFLFLFSCKKDVITTVVVPPIDNNVFTGYKVNSNAKQLGRNYWENITIPADLMLSVFQTSLKSNIGHTEIETEAISFGDFNLDGYIDIFNTGGSHNGPYTGFTFLIWDSTSKIFEQKNLFNDKSFNVIGGNPNKIIPIYLNGDDYVDFIIFDNGDEDIPNSPNEPIRYVLSDGKGGYDLKSIETNELEAETWSRKYGGNIGDVDGDGILDLIIVSNTIFYVYKGIPTYPYFIKTNRIKYININVINQVFDVEIHDFNNDGKKDIITIGKEDTLGLSQKILINYKSWGDSIIKIPLHKIGNKFETKDYIIDGNNIITLGHDMNNTWSLHVYNQKYSVFEKIDSQIHSAVKLIYQDYNNDGMKDIGFQESMGDIKIPKVSNSIYNKKVYIKEGNSFVKKSIYDFDNYAKEIRDKYFITN
jgi:hypothetical protein